MFRWRGKMEEKPIKEEESVEYLLPTGGQKIAIGFLALGLCVVLIYAFMEHRSIKQLAASRNELSAALNQQQGQIQTLTQKLLAAETATTPAPALATAPPLAVNSPSEEQAPVAKPRRVQHHPQRHAAVQKAQRAEDPWRTQIQSQLTAQQKQIAEQNREIQETKDSVAHTRADLESSLQSTRDDLNGSIAKTHEELVALEKKGERNFYEFNLPKSKHFQREGPMSVSLRKSNAKHKYCDLVLIVNDSEVTQTHVNLYEPVLFYPEGYSQPLQLVINGIGKDSARGYVSEPKYRQSELASGASSSGGPGPGIAGQTVGSSSAESARLKHRPDSQQ
jgi:uncharacterized coiled-coil protein SlyX/uncharacterized FlaG/YvyC family protein